MPNLIDNPDHDDSKSRKFRAYCNQHIPRWYSPTRDDRKDAEEDRDRHNATSHDKYPYAFVTWDEGE